MTMIIIVVILLNPGLAVREQAVARLFAWRLVI